MKKFIILSFVLWVGCDNLKNTTDLRQDLSSSPPSFATQPQAKPGAERDAPNTSHLRANHRHLGRLRTDGAYYLERNGVFTFECSPYSPNPVPIRSYIEKFAFQTPPDGGILVQHFDSKCSDMLFPPESFSIDEFFKLFTLSEDGLILRSERAINGREATFTWLAKDPE